MQKAAESLRDLRIADLVLAEGEFPVPTVSVIHGMCLGGGLEVALHSAGATSSAGAQCLVVDAMGELLRYYAAGDVAFVGGSLEPVGGHNVLEPAALGRPVLVGPHTFNFSDITAQLIDAGAAARVADGAALQAAVVELFGDADRRQRMGAAARQLVASGQGALARTLDEARAVDQARSAGAPLGLLAGLPYCTSKFAQGVMGLFANQEANEDGVRVTNIYPGEADTPILDQRPEPVPAEKKARMVHPEDIAAMVVAIAKLPDHVQVPELIITPLYQAYV